MPTASRKKIRSAEDILKRALKDYGNRAQAERIAACALEGLTITSKESVAKPRAKARKSVRRSKRS